MKILVIGSFHLHMTHYMDSFLEPGQTSFSQDFSVRGGGKGVNQAFAMQKMGLDVHFAGAIGKDLLSEYAQSFLISHGLLSPYIMKLDYPVGIATIFVNEQGQNLISLYSGANAHINKQDIELINIPWDDFDLLVLQQEINMVTVHWLIQKAHKHNIKVLLNATPGAPLELSAYQGLEYLVIHGSDALSLYHFFSQTHLTQQTAESTELSWQELAQWFLSKGIANVVITLGEEGVCYHDGQDYGEIPAYQVETIDVTGAVDAFIAGLICALQDECSLRQATIWGQCAAALTVQEKGTVLSFPKFTQVRQFYEQQNTIDS